jgi:NAD(P)-dependent dehydrogenase (short-subunit alcohol dehydrogenase family)
MNRLANKVALITGAGRGIGAAIALAFAREGAAVVLAELDIETAQRTARDIEQHARQPALAVRMVRVQRVVLQ